MLPIHLPGHQPDGQAAAQSPRQPGRHPRRQAQVLASATAPGPPACLGGRRGRGAGAALGPTGTWLLSPACRAGPGRLGACWLRRDLSQQKENRAPCAPRPTPVSRTFWSHCAPSSHFTQGPYLSQGTARTVGTGHASTQAPPTGLRPRSRTALCAGQVPERVFYLKDVFCCCLFFFFNLVLFNEKDVFKTFRLNRNQNRSEFFPQWNLLLRTP